MGERKTAGMLVDQLQRKGGGFSLLKAKDPQLKVGFAQKRKAFE